MLSTATTSRTALALLLSMLWITTQPSFAAEQAREGGKPPKLFTDTSEWQVTLTGPWRTIQKNKKKDARYPAQLTYPGADGQLRTINVEVSPRGISRRLRTCDFPPLKLHFDREQMKGSEFRGNKSLKLVTYCQKNTKYEQYNVKEYLVYRIYNLITDYSFRVKPMSVEYRDSKHSNSWVRFGFLIEDIDEVAKRFDLDKLNIGRIKPSELEPLQTSYLALFQYLIGNLDWAATGGPDKSRCCHNSRLIGTAIDEVPKYAIPYDFDSTGLVNAHYAAPPKGLKVRNLRQRLYRGFCAHNDTLLQAVDHFRGNETDIIALFENDEHLTDSSREKAISYIESFYRTINNTKRLQRDLIGKCRG